MSLSPVSARPAVACLGVSGHQELIIAHIPERLHTKGTACHSFPSERY